MRIFFGIPTQEKKLNGASTIVLADILRRGTASRYWVTKFTRTNTNRYRIYFLTLKAHRTPPTDGSLYTCPIKSHHYTLKCFILAQITFHWIFVSCLKKSILTAFWQLKAACRLRLYVGADLPFITPLYLYKNRGVTLSSVGQLTSHQSWSLGQPFIPRIFEGEVSHSSE